MNRSTLAFILICGISLSPAYSEDVQMHINYNSESLMKGVALDIINRHGDGFVFSECMWGYADYSFQIPRVSRSKKQIADLIDRDFSSHFWMHCDRLVFDQAWGGVNADNASASGGVIINSNGIAEFQAGG